MNREVVVTCAVTGSGDSVGKHPAIPVAPEQIADAAIEAAQAGAAVAHIHVRDPQTGKAARRLELYREVVQRVRASGVDVILARTFPDQPGLTAAIHDRLRRAAAGRIVRVQP